MPGARLCGTLTEAVRGAAACSISVQAGSFGEDMWIRLIRLAWSSVMKVDTVH